MAKKATAKNVVEIYLMAYGEAIDGSTLDALVDKKSTLQDAVLGDEILYDTLESYTWLQNRYSKSQKRVLKDKIKLNLDLLKKVGDDDFVKNAISLVGGDKNSIKVIKSLTKVVQKKQDAVVSASDTLESMKSFFEIYADTKEGASLAKIVSSIGSQILKGKISSKMAFDALLDVVASAKVDLIRLDNTKEIVKTIMDDPYYYALDGGVLDDPSAVFRAEIKNKNLILKGANNQVDIELEYIGSGKYAFKNAQSYTKGVELASFDTLELVANQKLKINIDQLASEPKDGIANIEKYYSLGDLLGKIVGFGSIKLEISDSSVLRKSDDQIFIKSDLALKNNIHRLFEVSKEIALILDPSEANGLYVAGEGVVYIVDNFNSNTTYNFANIKSDTVHMAIDSSKSLSAQTKLSSDASELDIVVSKGATLSLSALQADGAIISGDGKVVVTASSGDQEIVVLSNILGMGSNSTDDANIIRAGSGDDTITLGSGKNVLVFEDDAVKNGLDSVVGFIAGNGRDMLDFSGFLGDATLFRSGVVDEEDLVGDALDGDIAIIYGASLDGVNGIKELFVDAKLSIDEHKKAVILSASSSDASEVEIYYVNGATIEQVGVVELAGVNSISDFTVSNFVLL